MKIQLIPWPFLVIFAWVQICMNTHYSVLSSQCLEDHKSLLLELQTSLEFNHSASTKLVLWNQSTDCCHWSGVKCDDSTGQVIGLDLSFELINSGIDNISSLFRLQSLQSLNLAYNFIAGKIPSALSKLTSLTYLNLSQAGFSGKIPSTISHLVKLVTLDISTSPDFLDLRIHIPSPTFANIIQNLTHIQELYLDGVFISMEGRTWEMLSSSLPYLEVLSLSGCGLTGTVSRNLFKKPTLRILDLSNNLELHGTFDEFRQNGSLQKLVIGNTKFSGFLPNSISNLKRLRQIDLSSCNFLGIIPSSISSLNLLEYVDLSYNNFSGSIPSFSSAKNLTLLRLRSNNLNGSITSTNWGGLLKLAVVDLFNNSLTGRLPISLFSLSALQRLFLAKNKFSGQLNEFAVAPSSMLSILDLGSNNLEGLFPKSVLEFKGLKNLDLSWNQFNGTLDLSEILHQLKNISNLDLSNNALSMGTNGMNANSSFPQLRTLGLASCNLQVLPELLRNQQSLNYLDLSNNQIQGTIPNWIWKVGTGYLIILNLSCNHFVNMEQFLPNTSSFELRYLDLHSNNLQGQLPAIASQIGLVYLDYSSNNFTSINPDIGNSLFSALFFSLSRNEIYGSIPTSICNATMLEVLDLEYNHLNGAIPDCLIAMTKTLGVLNLRGNNFRGDIPDKFGKSCASETINFNGNFLQGHIPRSLAKCRKLQLLDLGNNQLNDTFPCQLKSLSKLKVVILRSNKFHGTIACHESISIWPSLQIMDLASNHFSGELMSHFLFKWGSMMAKTNQVPSELTHLQYQVSSLGTLYYQDSVVINLKTHEVILQKILITFTSIDFSDNAFHGELPRQLGNLNALILLNLSHNSFSGDIPSSLGNLGQLESLDLSCNALGGTIPRELANLNFLVYLNVSFNKLSGKIPTGTQLQSFSASSYEGNQGLYGQPLTLSGRNRNSPELVPPPSPDGSHWSSKSKLEWMLRGAEVGFPVGITVFIGPILYIKRWRRRYYYHVDRLIMKMLRKDDRGRQTRTRRASRKQQRQRR